MSGNDVLDGRGGDDDMYGESGNDTFRVDQAGDRVIETVGDGTDLVLSSLVSYTLPNNNPTLVESSGTIQGIEKAFANVIYGTSGHNGLVGNGGDDVLIGLGGPDAMFGGTGNDTYYVDDEGDVVGEVAGEGIDTVHASIPTYTLAEPLEVVFLPDPGATSGVGNSADNTLGRQRRRQLPARRSRQRHPERSPRGRCPRGRRRRRHVPCSTAARRTATR